MWTDKRFWLDASWRAFRTFCQTLAALLAAQFSGLLQATGVTNSGIPHTPWAGFLYASAIAGLISLLQSVDRERAVTWNANIGQAQPVHVDPTPTAPLPPAYYDAADPTSPVVDVQPFAGHGHGESLR